MRAMPIPKRMVFIGVKAFSTRMRVYEREGLKAARLLSPALKRRSASRLESPSIFSPVGVATVIEGPPWIQT